MRKKELDDEIAENKMRLKRHRQEDKEKKKLIKENTKLMKQRLEEYKEQQMLRFGSSLVDLDSLEVSGPSLNVLELTNKFEKLERDCIREIEERIADLDIEQRRLTEEVHRNTDLLNLIIQLGKKQTEQKQTLNQTKQDIKSDENADQRKMNLEEKERYKNVLKVQAKEIETLKAEINLFKRKGGHIYTKVTSKRTNPNHQD